MRKRGGKRQHGEARRVVRGDHVKLRRVDVEADEIDRRGDDLQFVGGKFRRVLAGIGEKAVGVFAFQDHAEEARIQFARRDLGGADIFGRVDRRQAGRDVLGRADLGARAPLGADRLHRETVAERDVDGGPGSVLPSAA